MDMDLKQQMQIIGAQARAASRLLANVDTRAKNAALLASAQALRRARAALLAANAQDVASAKAHGKDAAFIDRLTLGEHGVEGMAKGLEQVAALPDPVGEISEMRERLLVSGVSTVRT